MIPPVVANVYPIDQLGTLSYDNCNLFRHVLRILTGIFAVNYGNMERGRVSG